MLDDTKGKWVEELPHVLWTYITTRCTSTGETPFSMTYGAETVIPLETGFPTSRTSSFNPSNNDEQLTKSLDLIEEKRENVMVQLAYYLQKLKQGYDANVKLKPLTPNDLVLRKVVGAAKNPTWGKLGPNWEGPYRITLEARSGRACNTTSLECKQPKEVLLLINIFMINLFVLYIKCLYLLLFSSHKCLNLNPIMPEVFGPDDLN